MSALKRNQMAWRAAQDPPDGGVVNLGLGMPVLVSDYMPADPEIFLQSENGVLGVGPEADEDSQDRNLVDAGSRRITLREGARASSLKLESILFANGESSQQEKCAARSTRYGQALRRTGRPPFGNPKGRADLPRSRRGPSCP